MFEKYRFYFDIDRVTVGSAQNTYLIYVKSRIVDHEKIDYYEGILCVELNPVGIFPKPGDIAAAVSPTMLRRLLGMELKRYIKPQKRFLYELAEENDS